MRRTGRLCGCLGAACIALAVAVPARAEPVVAFLYVEPNEGDASGGHAGIRFGEHVFHFQNRAGLLSLDRVPEPAFRHTYALISNRDIVSTELEVDAEGAARLRRAFDRRALAQARQIALARELAADVRLFEAWLETVEQRDAASAAPPAEGPLAAPGLGYLERSPNARGRLSELARAIRAALGPDALARRRAETEATLAQQSNRLLEGPGDDPAAGWPAPLPQDRFAIPPMGLGWARRQANAAAALAVIDLLETGARLRSDALLAPPAPGQRLDAPTRRRLVAEADALEARLVVLAASADGGWAQPFGIGLARLLAIEAALDGNQLVVLDAFPPRGGLERGGTRLATIPHRVLVRHADVLEDMTAYADAQVDRARSAWLEAPPHDERSFARLEDSLNRSAELRRALQDERALRLAPDVLIPDRARALLPALPETAAPEVVAAWLDHARTRDDRSREAMNRLHGYHLLSYNCVSEIFQTLHAVDGTDALLGGHLDGRRGLDFIPAVANARVDDRYHVARRARIPAFRQRALERMREHEPDLWVTLRESNTLTAESYRRGRLDSFFVFFTDGAAWPRPILGAVNLGAAVGETSVGLGALPFDRGRTLRAGLSGLSMSVPELVFVNLRKGSNDWVPPDEAGPATH